MAHPWIVAAACAALIAGLGACAQLRADTSATAPVQSQSAAECYRQSDLGDGWVHLEGWSEGSCFSSDSCFGGLGAYAPGCVKWATGPNAPPLPWPAETEAARERTVPPEDEIPLEHGLFVMRLPCEDGPCMTRWRASARVPIYAEPDQFSRRVGRMNADEVVSAIETVNYIPATRGVMRYSGEGVTPGDIVYSIGSHCKGHDVWRRGRIVYADDDMVDWDPPPRLYNSRAGYWVRFERANGQRGWARGNVLLSHLTPINPRPQPEPGAEEDVFDECE